ncbi:MAG: M20/M25/M40 family metallo-hydrolase [Alphaproteobacteria bacterium]|nr:M20/M25/M40 family metallo-hydrolase [Alphaproteobacteria bacterium]
MKRICGLVIVAAASAFASFGAEAQSAPDASRIRAITQNDPVASLDFLRETLSLPNDATYPEEIAALLDWLEPQFQKRGFTTKRLPTDGNPVLFAERRTPGATKTALFYMHSDGQPVDPSKWNQPDPYKPVMKTRNADGSWKSIDWPENRSKVSRDWRVFARSSADDKGQIAQFLLAIDALDGAKLPPGYNIKLFIDTEEEQGSPHIASAIAANRDLLTADFLLIFDGPPHASGRPTVTLGARGIATITLTTYGPKTPQHSGHYGNYLPNPAFELARILSSMKDPSGRVLIKGYYDGVRLDEKTRAMLAATPDDETAILSRVEVAKPEKVAPSLQEALQYPSLNIRGMASAWVGKEARTVIPSTATAEIDIRTVKETPPERLVRLVRRHIEKLGYYVIDHEPSDVERLAHAGIVRFDAEISYPAFRSNYDSNASVIARSAIRRLYGEEPIVLRTSGGSVPVSPFVEALGAPAAIVSTVNPDNNQHSPNENLRVGEFLDGISIMAAIMTSPAP